MPSRWYKGNQRNNKKCEQRNVKDIFIESMITDKGKDLFKKLERDVFRIIDTISLRIELDKTLELATEFHNTMKTKKDAIDLIDKIEKIVYSILDNIISRTDLGLVIQRINYLKEIVKKIDPICDISYDKELSDEIMEVFRMIEKAFDINIVQSKIEIVHGTITNIARNEKNIREAERILIEICDNISTRTNLGIVMQRITYMKDLISKVGKDCIYYDSIFSQEVINIIILISQAEQSPNGIITELSLIEEKTKKLQVNINKKLKYINTLIDSETLIISILQNIIDRVDLGLVSVRLSYLQRTIQQIQNY